VLTCAVTVTRSPGVNGWRGRKLSPVPVEYARSTPECTPLWEPTARTLDTVVPASPRKLTWVLAEASCVPGAGDTATGLAAAALTDASGEINAELTDDPSLHAPSTNGPARQARQHETAGSLLIRTCTTTPSTALGCACA
jgi:hypothetical protein